MKEIQEYINKKKERNSQKNDINILYHSNSQTHYKDISNNNYENRIRLNPLGEIKSYDIRYNIPISHVKNHFHKNDLLSESNLDIKKPLNSYRKAEIESNILNHAKKQKYQKLIKNEKKIENICNKTNIEIKKDLVKKKLELKEKLIRIIKNSLIFCKKNNPIKSMLPDNINEIVNKVKQDKHDISISLNISNISKVSSIKDESKIQKKTEFLSLIGVNSENLDINNIDIDIEKAWKYIQKISKGRNIEDILRYKVVNDIMSVTEKKATKKAKKIYEKLEIYKKYMKKKNEEDKKNQIKEEKILIKKNPKEMITQRIKRSISQKKFFNDNKYRKIWYIKDDKKGEKKRDKKVMRLNSYNDVNKIINFIDESKINSQSKLCKEHFMNIQEKKDFDSNLKLLVKKNRIFLD